MTSKPHFYKQETPYSCVPACLRMVFSAKGLFKTEAELRHLCDCTPLGTEALKAVDAARLLGFSKTVKLTLSLTELTSFANSNFNPIVFVNLLPIDGNRGGHAVVVVGVQLEDILVYDPLQGERNLPRLTFETAWNMMHNIAIIVQS